LGEWLRQDLHGDRGGQTGAVLLREDHGCVTTLRMNRAPQLNALSEDMLNALQRELDTIATQPQVRCVVVAGTGRAFCAGHDLVEMQANRQLEYYQSLFSALQ
jgi:enoyl-CoA hydratase/carnithine racemase